MFHGCAEGTRIAPWAAANRIPSLPEKTALLLPRPPLDALHAERPECPLAAGPSLVPATTSMYYSAFHLCLGQMRQKNKVLLKRELIIHRISWLVLPPCSLLSALCSLLSPVPPPLSPASSRNLCSALPSVPFAPCKLRIFSMSLSV